MIYEINFAFSRASERSFGYLLEAVQWKSKVNPEC